MKKKILITGGTGLIGSYLYQKLKDNPSYSIAILTRKAPKDTSVSYFLWNPSNEIIDEEAITFTDILIHLAGAGIANKWTSAYKKTMYSSRVDSLEFLAKEFQKKNKKIDHLISSSAVGYYGNSSINNALHQENDSSGKDYLGQFCQDWENAAEAFSDIASTTSIVRTGVVLANESGALSKMLQPIMTPIGSGEQFVPWIHIEDVCAIYLDLIKQKLPKGTYNAVSPQVQTNRSLSKEIAKAYKRWYINIALPAKVLEIVLGEMATIVLKGDSISANKLLSNHFTFRYPNAKEALEDLYQKR